VTAVHSLVRHPGTTERLEVDVVAPQGSGHELMRVHGPDGKPQYVSGDEVEIVIEALPLDGES
jgi:hypothetical protein